MRKKIIAGNWKMNLLKDEAIQLAMALHQAYIGSENKQMMIFPPSLFLEKIITTLPKDTPLLVGAQNFHSNDFGAFTGENSITQLKDIGIKTALVGHSERRDLFHENNAFIKDKVDAALKKQFNLIFCCGEPLEIRENEQQNEFIQKQLEASLLHLSASQISSVTVAYEPIWAIGTGKTASATQAEEMHQFIRNTFQNKYGTSIAENLTILYGGSCKPSNAAELFAMKNIDGGLIGGAALKSADFLAIAKAL